MNQENFEIRIIGNYLVISRIVFPRIKVYMCRKRLMNEIVRIKLLDKCPASDIVPALRDIDELVSNLNPLNIQSRVISGIES